MRDLWLVIVLAVALAAVFDYVEATEARLARLERRPAVIIGGKWKEPNEREV